MRGIRRQNGEAGGGLIEFAISLVLILTVLFGIIDVGRAMYAYDWVANAARKGTRFMIVRGTGCANNPMPLLGGCPATATDSLNYITNANGNGLDITGIDPSQVQVNTLCFATNTVARLPPCAPDGGYVQVRVTYTFKFITPFLAAAFPSGVPMTSTSNVVVQN